MLDFSSSILFSAIFGSSVESILESICLGTMADCAAGAATAGSFSICLGTMADCAAGAATAGSFSICLGTMADCAAGAATAGALSSEAGVKM